MRLLHTSDWHLGRTLHGVDLLDHHQRYCRTLIETVREQHIDVVVVAGDVYDRAIPPTEAVSLLSETFTELAELTEVVVTSGNHDSATRLGFAAHAMRPTMHIATRLDEVATPIDRGTGNDRTLIYPIPYLDPDVARQALAVGDQQPIARSHQAVMDAAMTRIRADIARRTASAPATVVVVAHAFVTGGAPSESERDIRVGGVDSLAAATFAGANYVALGHLHGPQQISGPPGCVVRYSGSPLPFSFSEAGQVKSMVMVDLALDQPPRIELIPTPVARELAVLTGTLADLLGPLGTGHEDAWVSATVTDPIRPMNLYSQLKARFEHLLVVRHAPLDVPELGRVQVVSPAHDPLDVAADFFAYVTGRRPDAAECDVLRASLEEVRRAEMSA